jgi:hypothetical protein
MNGSALLFPPNSPRYRSHVVVVFGMELVVVVVVVSLVVFLEDG